MATVIHKLIYPQTIQIIEQPEIEAYLDDTLWLNETKIDWGIDTPGTFVCSLEVLNKGNVPFTVYLIVEDLTLGWMQTWNANGTVLTVGNSVTADLTLFVPSYTSPGIYNWNSYISAEA